MDKKKEPWEMPTPPADVQRIIDKFDKRIPLEKWEHDKVAEWEDSVGGFGGIPTKPKADDAGFKKSQTKKKPERIKRDNKELYKAGAFVGTGVTAGIIKGGAIGLAGFGTAVGAPLWAVGGACGLAVFGVYKALQSCAKNKTKRE